MRMQRAKPLPVRGVRTLVQFWVREPEKVLTKELDEQDFRLHFGHGNEARSAHGKEARKYGNEACTFCMMDQVVPARGSIILVPIGQPPSGFYSAEPAAGVDPVWETLRGTQDRTLIHLVLGLLVIRRRKDNAPPPPPPEVTYSSVTEESGGEINPFLSGKERGELLSSGEESNDDNDREGDEPPAKRKFVPTSETRFLESVL